MGELSDDLDFANQITDIANRPASISKSTIASKENGTTGGELDEASRRKAEARLLAFYETHTEPNTAAQGPADFN